METKERTFKVYIGEELVAEKATVLQAMDWVWDEQNTEEHPVHIIDENGNEIEW